MKKKLLIINKAQFGYHIDTYKYCQYMKQEFDITYLCFDTNDEKIEEDGINVVYLPYPNTFLKKGFSFISNSRKYIMQEKFDMVFIVYFLMSSFVKIGFQDIPFVLDIRTGAVDLNLFKRKIKNIFIKVETLFFNNISIISKSLGEKLKIKNAHILPLGSDTIAFSKKSYQNLHLLYVGSLYGRDIDKTVLGIAKFNDYLKKNHLHNKIRYDIIGFGQKNEEEKIEYLVSKNNLNDIVVFHGRKKHSELGPFFLKANIGVSFVPITDYYDCQPPTKTFEYINSGLFCIATNTQEHRNIISQENGLLCDDNSESFYRALCDLVGLRDKINSKSVVNSLRDYSWENIISKNLLPYLYQVIKQCEKR